jgi:2-polyprenyl-6-methoxyphenol hydroxylase-like FAD-dependent oxidoreductase
MDTNFDSDVLISGAGPTGLLLAYILASNGVAVRLVERREGPSRESRAMVIQARTLEFYDMLGLAEKAIKLGMRLEDGHLLVEGRQRMSFSLKTMGPVGTKFPFVLALPQNEHEAFLISELSALGVSPEWNTELVGIDDRADRVEAYLSRKDGRTETCTARWLIGCDGSRSFVRKRLGIEFEGGTTEGTFFVADVGTSPSLQDVYFALDAESVTLMLPVRSSGTHRLIGVVPDSLVGTKSAFSAMTSRLQELLGVSICDLRWFSTYQVSHKVAGQYRHGRCLIVGDAAHVHSPIGGQGMNTGLGDAVNLAWKLAAVIQGRASQALLDSYERERKPVADKLVSTTDRLFKSMISKGMVARLLRLWIVPTLISAFARLDVSKRAVFKLIGELHVGYPDSLLNAGGVGRIKSGERLPWVKDLLLFESLDGLNWAAVSFGDRMLECSERLTQEGLTIIHRPLTTAARKAGYKAGTLYLVRPDGYIGTVMRQPAYQEVRQYFERIGIRPEAQQREPSHVNGLRGGVGA